MNGKTKINIQTYLCGFQGKRGEKTFCCRICHTKPLQLGNMGIKSLMTHGKTSSHIKKVEAIKSQSSHSNSFEASA